MHPQVKGNQMDDYQSTKLSLAVEFTLPFLTITLIENFISYQEKRRIDFKFLGLCLIRIPKLDLVFPCKFAILWVANFVSWVKLCDNCMKFMRQLLNNCMTSYDDHEKSQPNGSFLSDVSMTMHNYCIITVRIMPFHCIIELQLRFFS